MLKIKSQIIYLFFSTLLFSCGIDDTPPHFDYSNKIMGEWKQVTTFNIKDSTATPPTYDWYDVEDGFTLQLSEDGTFTYTKYESCTTGEYFYDSNLSKIEFNFDCEIDFYGESITSLTEYFAADPSQNLQLFLMHQNGPDACEKECNSILRRIE